MNSRERTVLLVVVSALLAGVVLGVMRRPPRRPDVCVLPTTRPTDVQGDDEGLLDLSTASEVELISLPGVGPVIAARILQYRKDNGGFRAVSELLDVAGIGPRKMAVIRPLVRVGQPAAERRTESSE